MVHDSRKCTGYSQHCASNRYLLYINNSEIFVYGEIWWNGGLWWVGSASRLEFWWWRSESSQQDACKILASGSKWYAPQADGFQCFPPKINSCFFPCPFLSHAHLKTSKRAWTNHNKPLLTGFLASKINISTAADDNQNSPHKERFGCWVTCPVISFWVPLVVCSDNGLSWLWINIIDEPTHEVLYKHDSVHFLTDNY